MLLARFDAEKEPGVRRSILRALASLKYAAAAPLAAYAYEASPVLSGPRSEITLSADEAGFYLADILRGDFAVEILFQKL